MEDVGFPDWLNAAVSTGTTIIATEFDGGVVLGADTRVTTGTYISNRVSDKISSLTDNVYLCRSGSAADTQTVTSYVRYFLQQHTIELGGPCDVKTAANVCMQIAYNNKRMLEAGMLVAGWDKWEGGAVYAIPIGGTLLRVPFSIGGSGSSYLYGFCDQAWKENMTRDEAEKFVLKAVSLAIARDGGSGGCVRTITVTEKGAFRQFYPSNKLPLFHEELPPQESLLSSISEVL